MKERPILFSGPMVRAILEGRKSQTRRVAKLRSTRRPSGLVVFSLHNRCPYGAPGDRLWVRETWCPVDDREEGGKLWVDYRATPRYSAEHPAGWDAAPADIEALKWRPSIHMPHWASRISLEVTDVRCERLQD